MVKLGDLSKTFMLNYVIGNNNLATFYVILR